MGAREERGGAREEGGMLSGVGRVLAERVSIFGGERHSAFHFF